MEGKGPEIQSEANIVDIEPGNGLSKARESELTDTRRSGWLKRLLSRRVNKKVLSAAAVATAGTAAAVGTVLVRNDGVVSNQEDHLTISDTEKTQIIESHPTIGVKNIPGTLIPNPNIETSGNGKSDIQPLTTSTSLEPTTSSVETTQTPEKPKSAWKVTVAPGLEGKSSSGVLLEDQVTLVKEAFSNFPTIGNLEVRIVDGSSSSSGVDVVEIGRELSPDAMVWAVNHELTHHFDVLGNENELAKYFTNEQIDQLKILREQTLGDPIWGREYPDLSKMLNSVKNNLYVNFSKGFTRNQIVQLTDLYPDGIWLGRRFLSTDYQFPIWEKLMPDTYKQLESYQANSEGVTGVITITDFLKLPTVAPKIGELSAKDPLFAKAIEQINKDALAFKLENVSWNSVSAPILTASSGFTGWYALRTFVVDAALSESYLGGDPVTTGLVVASGMKNELDQELKSWQFETDKEKFAEIMAAQVSFKVPTSADKYLSALWSFSR